MEVDTPSEYDASQNGADEAPESTHKDASKDSAPRYSIPRRKLAAVEVPANVQNVDRAVAAFGRVSSLNHALDPDRHSIPLYLNPESPFCRPLMSNNSKSHNVVLKITVPKRTGRKRKRGSDEPWQGDVEVSDTGDDSAPSQQVASRSRMDEPKFLKRKLVDNEDKYKVEAVGVVNHTHRFRGLADFYWDSYNRSDFARRYVDQVLPGDPQKMKEFGFVPGIDTGPNVDVLPPPVFTHMNLPFNYQYSQNPYVRTTKDGNTYNATAVKQIGHFIGAEDPIPTGPQQPPDMTDPRTVEVMGDLEMAFDERPVWTRRSLMNYLGGKLRSWNELRTYLHYTAYQFKGGPWRDTVVPYGLDPRIDPKYRIYQTVMFKLRPRNKQAPDAVWYSLLGRRQGLDDEFQPDMTKTHLFDGETYHLDGKVWQMCDITDPLLRDLLDNATVRPERDGISGWYHGGLWAKIKSIMKRKIVAIRSGRRLTAADFAGTLSAGDETPIRTANTTSGTPSVLPDFTDDETTLLRDRESTGDDRFSAHRQRGMSVRARGGEPAGGFRGNRIGVPGQEDFDEFEDDGEDEEDESEDEQRFAEEGEGESFQYPDVPV